MSSNPFEMRLQELQSPETVSEQPVKFEEIVSEQPKKNPFENRLEQKESQSSGLWEGFMDLIYSKDETPFEQGLGQSLRGVIPAIGGIPGDVIHATKGLSSWLEEKLPSPKFLTPPKSPLKEKIRELVTKTPTSEDIQNKFDSLTESKFLPKSESEAFLQELGGDIATLMLPAKSAKGALKVLGVATGSNLAKQGMKELGFGDAVQAGTKIGTMMTLSMFNPNGAKKYVKGLYDSAFAELPKGAEMSAAKFAKNLNQLENTLSKGIPSVESKKPVMDAIKQVERNIKGGRVEIRDLTEAKRNLNELRTAKVYDPEFKGTRKVRADLKKNFSKLSKTLDDAILEYGEGNKDFAKLYKEAQLGWGGIEQSRTASEFIKRNTKNLKFKSALGIPAYFFPTHAAGAAAIGLSGLKSYELMHRMFSNPTLRKHYLKTLAEATRENATGVVLNLKKFDSELDKMEKNQQ